MKKLIFAILGVIAILSVVFFVGAKKNGDFEIFKTGNKSYRLLKAVNSKEWERGLMGFRSKAELKGADGMVFIFPDKKIRYFWNKNTYLDLTVYWVDGEKIIGTGELPSIKKTGSEVVISSPAAVDRVIEIAK